MPLNFDRIEKFLTCGSSPSSVANPDYEPNQTPSFWSFILCPIKSPSFQQLLMTSLHDLRFRPLPNSKSRLRLCIIPCAICIPDTGRGTLVLLAHLHEWLAHLHTLQRRKATKYPLHCFQSKISLVWKYGMKYGRKFYYGMEYGRKFYYGMEYGMEDFWYGMEMEWKKIASIEYGKIIFHSLPYHALINCIRNRLLRVEFYWTIRFYNLPASKQDN